MPSSPSRGRKATNRRTRGQKSTRPRCGLCGATTGLTKTECCGHWICDDEDEYVLFSFALNSCHRNHSRYTLCGFHYSGEHTGHWKDCEKCLNEIETEMYVYCGTNEYNFEILEHPPDYKPTKCVKCGATIVLAEGGYSQGFDGYKCGKCTMAEFPDLYR